MKLEETGLSKIITHMADLKDLFPDIDIGKSFMEFLVNYFKLMLPIAFSVIVFSESLLKQVSLMSACRLSFAWTILINLSGKFRIRKSYHYGGQTM